MRTAFLKSSSALLQVISNLLFERAQPREAKLRKKTSVTFTFNFLSKDEAKVWTEEYQNFEKRVQERLKSHKTKEKSMDYIVFGGLTPLRS
jgi:hypothetical protein